ncbi:MAG: 6-carboxytetrahydropterin synthase QueD [Candidatus Methanospirareceae archaeon]
MKVGVSASFSAAHFLPRYRGRCENMHGHTYKVEVVVEGEKDKENEFVVDFAIIKGILKEVLAKLDHRLLNDIITYPTTENIALFLKEELEKRLKDSGLNISLHSVKVWEGEGKWVMLEL